MATPDAGFSCLYESSSSSGQPSLHGMLSVICAPIFAKPAPEESTPKWPANACETCKNSIIAAFKLHQQCIETDRQLNKIFAVKLEVEEEVVEEPKDNIDDPLEEIKVEPLEVMMVELDENDAADDDKSDDGGDNSSDSDWEEDDTEKRTCKVCSKVVDKVSQLGKHMKKEHPDRPHVCRICSESFKSYSGLQYHKVTHKGPATCDECGKTFVTKGSLNNHQKLGHCHGKKYPFAAEAGKNKSRTQGDQSKTCKVCGEVQKNAYALNVHVKKLHADSVLHCDECNLVFFKPYGLEKHKKSHASGQFSVCKICKEEFPTRDAMRYHMRNHDGPFNCTVCDKLIHTKTALTTHMKRHSGHKPFSCEMCPMKFFSRMEKIQHMVTHTKVRDHVCDLCGSGFTKSDSLIKHKIRVHESKQGRFEHLSVYCEASLFSRTSPFPVYVVYVEVCQLSPAAAPYAYAYRRKAIQMPLLRSCVLAEQRFGQTYENPRGSSSLCLRSLRRKLPIADRTAPALPGPRASRR